MERLRRIATMVAGIGQLSDEIDVLEDDIGQPWVTISGRASGWGERTWRKWTFWPSTVVVNCG